VTRCDTAASVGDRAPAARRRSERRRSSSARDDDGGGFKARDARAAQIKISCERRKSRARRTEEERAEALFLRERRRRRRTQSARCASSSNQNQLGASEIAHPPHGGAASGGALPSARDDDGGGFKARDARAALNNWQAERVEQVTLVRARAGDEQAFQDLTDPYRRELQAHCYRMLGSLTDAEDILQETLLAAWRGLPGFEGRSSLRSWLYRIATNTCLNAIRADTRRVPSEPRPPFQPPEPTRREEIRWLQPYPDALLEGIADPAPGPEARYSQSQAIELAFVAGLQRMPPRQAAAVVLRDVLGFGTDEVAAMLQTSQTAVKGALQRGRAALESSREKADSPQPRSAEERDVARRFADAYVAADIDAVLTLLTDDAWLSMPPAPHQYYGLDAIRSFLQASFDFRADRRLYMVSCRANNQPSFGSYLADLTKSIARPAGLIVLSLAADRIQAPSLASTLTISIRNCACPHPWLS
jgi:RNA polymerase sigma-70 factor (TIGR02960 family)